MTFAWLDFGRNSAVPLRVNTLASWEGFKQYKFVKFESFSCDFERFHVLSPYKKNSVAL